MYNQEMYKNLGVEEKTYKFGEKIIEQLKDRFENIDKISEYNQNKILYAMQKNKIDAACMQASTGYG